jgi:hypothetical protein
MKKLDFDNPIFYKMFESKLNHRLINPFAAVLNPSGFSCTTLFLRNFNYNILIIK